MASVAYSPAAPSARPGWTPVASARAPVGRVSRSPTHTRVLPPNPSAPMAPGPQVVVTASMKVAAAVAAASKVTRPKCVRFTAHSVSSPPQRSTLVDLLHERTGLKRSVVQCFRLASQSSSTLNLDGLHRFIRMLCRELSVDEAVFGDLTTEYMRFDFNGTGNLEVNEAYKLVKFSLRAHCKARGLLEGASPAVPLKGLRQAGYQLSRLLGEGNQGVAWLAMDAHSHEVCVKMYEKQKMNTSGIEELKDEFETLQLLECAYIARAFEIFQDTTCYYIVGEPYFGGSFETVKAKATQQGISITEDWWRRLFRQCFEALSFMHQQAMMHCDIKEPNLMIRTDNFRLPQAVLIDFGVSKAMVSPNTTGCAGTPGYIPPETWVQRRWFPGGDVFSMGVVMLQLLTDKTPASSGVRTCQPPRGIFLEGTSTYRQVAEVTRTRQPPVQLISQEYSGITEVVQATLRKDVMSRLRAPQVLAHPWFSSPATVAAAETGRESLVASQCKVDGTEGSLEDSNATSGVKARHPFATVGITKSFLDSVDGKEDLKKDFSPHTEALLALRDITR